MYLSMHFANKWALLAHDRYHTFGHYPRTNDCVDVFGFFSQVKELASTQCKRNGVVKFTKMIINLSPNIQYQYTCYHHLVSIMSSYLGCDQSGQLTLRELGIFIQDLANKQIWY